MPPSRGVPRRPVMPRDPAGLAGSRPSSDRGPGTLRDRLCGRECGRFCGRCRRRGGMTALGAPVERSACSSGGRAAHPCVSVAWNEARQPRGSLSTAGATREPIAPADAPFRPKRAPQIRRRRRGSGAIRSGFGAQAAQANVRLLGRRRRRVRRPQRGIRDSGLLHQWPQALWRLRHQHPDGRRASRSRPRDGRLTIPGHGLRRGPGDRTTSSATTSVRARRRDAGAGGRYAA